MKFSYWIGAGIILILSVITLFYVVSKPISNHSLVTEEKVVALQDTLAANEPTCFFGMEIDTMLMIHNTIKKNQYLSDILSTYNVNDEIIYSLSVNSKGVFDLRKIGMNKPYDLVCINDSLQTAKLMVYYPNEIDYVVFHLEDSAYIETGSREVITAEQTATGIIRSSLAVTVADMGLSPLLTNELADVFAWQIDFFLLYPGDRFKVIYEEQRVDGKQVKIGDIKAAVFEHNGHNYYAYYYNQGTSIDYFDEEGKSLRKAFLKYPVQFSRISSRYSGNRYHPVQKRYKAHKGTDFAAPKGTPIRSVGEGVVIEAKYSQYNGNYVKIKHNSIYTTQYLHMSKIAKGMKPGTHVKQGQTIGFVGSTGLAAGNHVCYRFWKSGYQVDALKVKLPSSEPIKDELLTDYKEKASTLKLQLDALSYPEETQVSLEVI